MTEENKLNQEDQKTSAGGGVVVGVLAFGAIIFGMTLSICYGMKGREFVLFWLREILLVAFIVVGLIIVAIDGVRKSFAKASNGKSNVS